MTLIEAAKQALKALEYDTRPATEYGINTAITALDQAIAKAEQQEPVAWLPPDPPPECSTDAEKTAFAFGWFKALESQRLSTSPPKREWQGLTDQEIFDEWDRVDRYAPGDLRIKSLARAIEAKLMEKNT